VAIDFDDHIGSKPKKPARAPDVRIAAKVRTRGWDNSLIRKEQVKTFMQDLQEPMPRAR
jgi:hypothetical protein